MKYTDSHEWIELEGSIGIVGVTNFAQKELGDIVYVELPQVGKTLKAGEEAAVLESTKAAADVYAPVSGTVTEINQALAQNPSLINTAAEKAGWMYKVQLSNLEEVEKLLDEDAYKAISK